MSILSIPSTFRSKAPKTAARPVSRARKGRPSPLGAVEQFEDRLLMTGIGLIGGGTGQLTTGSGGYFVGKSLAPAVGFAAAAPTLSADGSSLVFGFDNTNGTGPITVGLSTYLTQSVNPPIALSTEVLEGTQTITLAKGQGPTSVSIPIEPCVQVDAYIEAAAYNGSTQGSQPIAHFSPILDTPAYASFAAPAVDAGYNTTHFVPTATNSTVPAGTLGTLVSYAQTDNAGAPGCPPSAVTGSVTTNCNGTPMTLAGQPVTLTGTGPAGAFSLATTTGSNGSYSFSIPYADLPAGNVTIATPVTSAELPGTASAGTVSSSGGLAPFATGVASVSPTSEQVSNIPINFGGQTASNYNFSLNLPSSISGVAYNDATGNGLGANNAPQAGDTPLAGATVTLTNTQTKAGASVVTKADGTYSFAGLPSGTYTVTETAPGLMNTGPNGGSYSVTLNSCQNLTGYNFADIPTCVAGAITGITYTDSGPNGTTTSSTLAGLTHQGDLVTANFTVTGTMPVTVTLVSYTATDGGFDLTTQKVFQDDTETLAPGKHTLTVTVPDSFYQVDFVCGTAITAFNPWNNNTYHGESRFIDADRGGSEAPLVISSFSSLAGTVYLDTTGNFAKDAGLAGVTVTLTGTDANKVAVTETRVTAADGSYSFQGLQPGTYTVTETTPAGYATTMDAVGTAGGKSSPTAINPNLNTITLAPGVSGSLYDFGVTNFAGKGSTGSTCFWTSCQGIQLIDSFNGGPCSTSFGNWLATQAPHLAGCFAGQTNQQIACEVSSLAWCWGADLESQLLDTALSIYATSSNLSGPATAALAAKDGFTVTPAGSGASLFNVGTQLASYGGPTGNVSLQNLLQYVDANACQLNNWCFDLALDSLFGAINKVGGIGC